MPWTPAIERALSVPAGARFYRCALQVNPATYSETFRGRPATLDPAAHAAALIEKAVALGIEVIAVTDHNSAAGVDAIAAAAAGKGVVVFPGFEIASCEGAHVLCVYNPGTTQQVLGRFLGEFGIRGVDPSAALSTLGFTEVLHKVRDQGGVPIAAHVTESKGVLTCLHGQARVNAWRDENLLAIQIPGDVDGAPTDKRAILKNQTPEYRRDPPRGDMLAIAVVNAKDVVTPDDLAEPSASCWIRMTRPSIDGLVQAFLDPGSRIRLSGDPAPTPHTELLAVAWEGGFLDGQVVRLNENLNVFVGGRGTGKSTAVESVRYALQLEALGPEAAKAHSGFVKNVLRDGSKVSLLVRTHTPDTRDFLIERTVPNPPVVKEETGRIQNIAPMDLVRGIEVFGQHEIAELAHSPEELAHLLDRFVKPDPDRDRLKREARARLERTRGEIVQLQKSVAEADEQLARLPALEETLSRFRDAGVEERLKEQMPLVEEEQLFNRAAKSITGAEGLLQTLRRERPIDTGFLAPEKTSALPAAPSLAKAKRILETLQAELGRAGGLMETAIQQARSEMAAVRAEWDVQRKATQEKLNELLRDLDRKGLRGGSEFLGLQKQLQDMRPLRDQRAGAAQRLKEALDERKAALDGFQDTLTQQFRELERAAKRVNKQLSGRVQVRVVYAGSRTPLEDLLRERLGGRTLRGLTSIIGQSSLSLLELAAAAREGKSALVKKYGIGTGSAEQLSAGGEALFMELEELELPAIMKIELNVASEGQPAVWKSLDDLSTGQKATAVLLLLLLESDAPLIVDQPEDDLDNRFITEHVVPKMKEEKRRRQFIFASHNANIPVLGDAEQIVGLAASGEAGAGTAVIDPQTMGSIDVESVRVLVEELLEGGRDAFELRRQKYGF